MSRYIDFEIAREYLHKACESLGGNGGLMMKIKFDEEPKADVVEVVHGKWIEEVDTMGGYEDYYPINYYCSKCEYLSRDGKTNYCPDCGAKMEV